MSGEPATNAVAGVSIFGHFFVLHFGGAMQEIPEAGISL
jgi:hypothetical protein